MVYGPVRGLSAGDIADKDEEDREINGDLRRNKGTNAMHILR